MAAGPVGRSAEATGTVANLAPVYSYSKVKAGERDGKNEQALKKILH